ncbi:hypothetical protein [Flammeovirga agarivorans]|uniref:Uncharacterized protein n=1 Tax=Flammeovirga agarivorans TaxID=2726742 RepID=A0A7X8SRU4_9BACT|nr:hypothetical protein [Flammeovirga agarivorans]NLR95094.1 hypothetical protein [Flammeovirga agarivorans]
MKRGQLIILTIILTSCWIVDNDKTVDKSIVDLNRQVLQKQIDNMRGVLRESTELVNQEYVTEDLEILTGLVNEIPKLKPNYEEFAKHLPGFQGKEYHLPEQNRSIEVGFDLTVTGDIYYGGYGNFVISILHYKQDILLVNINMYFTGQGHEFIRDVIIDHINFPIKCSSYGVYYTQTFDKNIKKYQALNIFPLRLTPTSDDYLETELAYYETMSNPTHFLKWGRSCGDGGGPTIGKTTIDSLTKSDNYKLVEDILYSPSVVGRIYAMQALERWDWNGEHSLTEKTKETIQKIKNLDVPFSVCDGCFVETMTFKQLAERKPWIDTRNWTKIK